MVLQYAGNGRCAGAWCTVDDASAFYLGGSEATQLLARSYQCFPEHAKVLPSQIRGRDEHTVDETNTAVDETNGAVDETSGVVEETNMPVDQTNGAVDETNRAVDQMNGAVDQTNGSVAGPWTRRKGL